MQFRMKPSGEAGDEGGGAGGDRSEVRGGAGGLGAEVLQARCGAQCAGYAQDLCRGNIEQEVTSSDTRLKLTSPITIIKTGSP